MPTVDPAALKEGLTVFGVDGEEVGTIKALGAGAFLVDRPLARDVYVPLEFVEAVLQDTQRLILGEFVRLTIPASQVDDMGWRHP